jgi:hypothetical protein
MKIPAVGRASHKNFSFLLRKHWMLTAFVILLPMGFHQATQTAVLDFTLLRVLASANLASSIREPCKRSWYCLMQAAHIRTSWWLSVSPAILAVEQAPLGLHADEAGPAVGHCHLLGFGKLLGRHR